MALINEPPASAVFAQAEILVGLELTRTVGVVEFDDVEIFKRIADTSHPVSADGGHATRAERMHARVAKVRVIRLLLVRQQRHLPARTIGEPHAVAARADADDPDRVVAEFLR